MTPYITAISSRICGSMASSRPGAGFDGEGRAEDGELSANNLYTSIHPQAKERQPVQSGRRNPYGLTHLD
jgi:hypothetical protein